MKKICWALMCMASLMVMVACGGGNNGGSAAGGESGSGSGSLADGKWPASVYDQYGIPEIETKGRIVCTQFEDLDGPYQYEVYYNGVTKEEMQAWVKKLQEKGFRTPIYTQERIDKGIRDYDAILFQPGEQKDKCLRIQYDFERPMSFEYYADEPNPAFEVVERDGEQYIEYNLTVSLNPIDNKPRMEGSYDALGVKAEDFAGIPNIRVIDMSSNPTGGSISCKFYRDHQLTEEDFDALHGKVADVFEAQGVKFSNTLTGKSYTAAELKADKVRSYTVEKDGKKLMMMAMSDDRVGDFGGGVTFRFMLSNK
ncbi:MAG: hypothetical protein IJ693_01590 [Bacteroidaceae bacterium]|nr:hypothetical protein [Bacteroidaceae bacterium]